ncbi:MAG: glucuronate isomerase [Cytophagales bacterium]|nr:glucuronate isomerase [Cytophagales bacterium]
MPKAFIDQDFLLQTRTAQLLYHDFAAHMPIIDYHNHLSAKQVAENMVFENITQAWLYGDHYKWRAMRANGVNEEYITGKNTSDRQKFEKWAYTVPYTMRNPLYHWTHLELQRYFDIHELLSANTSNIIYERTSQILQTLQYSTQNLLQKMKVETICTTDDPIDDLVHHEAFNAMNIGIKMYPTFRADKVLEVYTPENYKIYVQKLGESANLNITSLSHLMGALTYRHDYFARRGCKLSDHGLDTIPYAQYNDKDVEASFQKLMRGVKLNSEEISQYQSFVLYHLALLDAQKGWVQQFHIGALRNNNTRLQKIIGADCGADSIGDFTVAQGMAQFFNKLDTENKLTKTIIYNLNPAYNEVFASMIGNFQDGNIVGKIQFGSGWWFLDQKDGMEKQINALSNMGLLSRFVGMLTDSRSFLSFPRHEYFRRILCNILGNDIENGELPNDMNWIGQMVQNICYHNAKNYFNLN